MRQIQPTPARMQHFHSIGKVMSLLSRSCDILNKITALICAVAIGLLPIMIFYDVIARYFFNAPTIWASELALYIVQGIVFLPMGLLINNNDHVRVTLLTDHLSTNTQKWLHAFSLFMVIIFSIIIIIYGWQYTTHTWTQGQLSPTLLAVPLWLPSALIPLGGLFLLINTANKLIFDQRVR